MHHKRRFVASAAHRHRRKKRRIGFHQQAVKRHFGKNIAQFAGFVESNDTKEDSELVFHVGDIVKIKKGAKSYTGVTMASFVYENNYRIDELDGDRAVLDKSGICTDFKTSDLEKV